MVERAPTNGASGLSERLGRGCRQWLVPSLLFVCQAAPDLGYAALPETGVPFRGVRSASATATMKRAGTSPAR